jgi:hypothetical protein
MKQVKNLILLFGVVLLIMSLGVVSSAQAKKTPDGQTPAEESVCDGEVGAAFGLCNAYCEAMDCESSHPHASKKACKKVRNLYIKVTGFDLPCAIPAIPEDNAQTCCNGLDDDRDGLIDNDDPDCTEFINNGGCE